MPKISSTKKTEQPIEAGWLKAIGNVASFLGAVLAHGVKSLFDALSKADCEIKDAKETDDGGFTWRMKTGGGHELACKILPVKGRSNVGDLYIKTKDGKKKVFPHVSADNIQDTITKWVDSVYEGEGLEDLVSEKLGGEAGKDFNSKEDNDAFGDDDFDTFAGKKIRVGLQKVTASTGTDIKCTAVYTNYAPYEAYTDLCDICQDDTFCDSLTETPQLYNVILTEDGFNVEPCTECVDVDTSSVYTELVKCFYTAALNLQNLHWNIRGPKFMRIHEILGDYYYHLTYDIDTIAEIGLQSNCSIENPVKLVSCLDNACPDGNITDDESIQLAINVISNLIASLEFYYPNVPHEVQSILDDMINYWKKEIEFKLVRIIG